MESVTTLCILDGRSNAGTVHGCMHNLTPCRYTECRNHAGTGIESAASMSGESLALSTSLEDAVATTLLPLRT